MKIRLTARGGQTGKESSPRGPLQSGCFDSINRTVIERRWEGYLAGSMKAAFAKSVQFLANTVAGAKFSSKMDLRAGFYNLRMHSDSIKSTAFYFPRLGTYVWKVHRS